MGDFRSPAFSVSGLFGELLMKLIFNRIFFYARKSSSEFWCVTMCDGEKWTFELKMFREIATVLIEWAIKRWNFKHFSLSKFLAEKWNDNWWFTSKFFDTVVTFLSSEKTVFKFRLITIKIMSNRRDFQDTKETQTDINQLNKLDKTVNKISKIVF